jgi:AmiR/NasT family two-component response regulator
MTASRILVAADEDMAEVLNTMLVRLGYEIVAISQRGRIIIELTKRLKPDLVIMDVKLEDGEDATVMAKELVRSYNTPVVYVSAYADPLIIDRAMASNPYGYILEPFNSDELRIVLNRANFIRKMRDKLIAEGGDRRKLDMLEKFRLKVIDRNMEAIENKMAGLLKNIDKDVWRMEKLLR